MKLPILQRSLFIPVIALLAAPFIVEASVRLVISLGQWVLYGRDTAMDTSYVIQLLDKLFPNI